MADANRCDGYDNSVRRRTEAPTRSSHVTFPPGPADHKAWGELLVREPWLRPAISQAEAESLVCRGADGVSGPLDLGNRTGRLKALGNAVVPAVAEWIGQQIMEADRVTGAAL